jgi:hypothetical protein
MLMTAITREIAEMIEILPESEQNLAYELIKRMVLAWDQDFTKLTPMEQYRLDEAEKDFANGDTLNHEDIDWD